MKPKPWRHFSRGKGKVVLGRAESGSTCGVMAGDTQGAAVRMMSDQVLPCETADRPKPRREAAGLSGGLPPMMILGRC